MRFQDFATAGDAFFYLGRHNSRTCLEACCRPTIRIEVSGPDPFRDRAPPLPPELQCQMATECEEEEEEDQDGRELARQPPLERCSYCVLDTETTGLSGEDVALQCAFGLFDSDGNLLQLYDRIWNLPPGVRITRRAFQVHKIGYKKLNALGMPAARQLRIIHNTFKRLRERKIPIVAHNAAFDVRLLQQTAAKHGVDEWDLTRDHVLCTMQRAKPYAGLTSPKTGKPKAPSNSELYRLLHDNKAPAFGALHDASTDIKLTAACFAAGRARGWW